MDWSRRPGDRTIHPRRTAPPLEQGLGRQERCSGSTRKYWKLGIHRPSIKNKHLETGFPTRVHWLNGSGLPMEDYFKFRGWRSIRRTIGYDWAADEPLRGEIGRQLRGAQVPRQRETTRRTSTTPIYWALQDRNEVEDRAYPCAIAPDRARHHGGAALQDPVLNRLHVRAAAGPGRWRGSTDYRKTPAYQELRDGLIAASQVPITDVEA